MCDRSRLFGGVRSCFGRRSGGGPRRCACISASTSNCVSDPELSRRKGSRLIDRVSHSAVAGDRALIDREDVLSAVRSPRCEDAAVVNAQGLRGWGHDAMVGTERAHIIRCLYLRASLTDAASEAPFSFAGPSAGLEIRGEQYPAPRDRPRTRPRFPSRCAGRSPPRSTRRHKNRHYAVVPDRFTCPVSGYPELEEPPWTDGSGSDEICPSCGIHFGYDDAAGGDAARREMKTTSESSLTRKGCPGVSEPRSGPEIGIRRTK